MRIRTPALGRARAAARAIAVGAALTLVLAGCRPPAGTGPAKGFEGQAKQAQRTSPDTRPWFCNAVGNGTPPSGHGNGAHVNPYYEGKTKGPLSWPDCSKLAKELDETVGAVKGLETKAKGEAAGWREAAPYVPGLGTHHVKTGGSGTTTGSMPGAQEIQRIRTCLQEKGVDLSGGAAGLSDPTVAEALRACGVPALGAGDTAPGFGSFDPAKPPILIYGGEAPDAPLVGVAYAFAGSASPPEAYTGGNDWWHIHTQTCFGLDPKKFPDPDDLSDDECRALGGRPQKIFPSTDGKTPGGVWLLHVWLLPPYEYRPDLFVSGHPCLLDDGVAPQSDPCWTGAHRDPALGAPPTTSGPGGPGGGSGGDHGGHGH